MTITTSLISPSAVQGAYRNSKDLVADTSLKPEKTEGPSFSEMLSSASERVVSSMNEADAVMETGLKGELDTQQIVEATMALESSITVAVSVRDKFVAAYQEILRMPI